MPPQRMSYRAIADDITSRIRSGEYPPGSELPSSARIAELYSVGKTTADAALALLRERGLTVGVPGVGTFVADDAIPR